VPPDPEPFHRYDDKLREIATWLACTVIEEGTRGRDEAIDWAVKRLRYVCEDARRDGRDAR
jgi:hypothetical protein